MKIEHGLYYVSVPSEPVRVTPEGSREFDLVGLPALLQRRRMITIEKDGEPTIVTTKNRRGVETKKMARTTIKEEHEVCDVVCMLHDLTPEQRRAAEIAGLTAHLGGASVHTGVYESDKPEERRFVADGARGPVDENATPVPPTKPKQITTKKTKANESPPEV